MIGDGINGYKKALHLPPWTFTADTAAAVAADDVVAIDARSSDHFRMFEYKVRMCTSLKSHDWTECPFAHPGEKARRRDPRRFHYSGAVCPEFRRGSCRRGSACEFAHGVFECWLHPARYRTQLCKDGVNCTRRVCFFAHSPHQLRILSPHRIPVVESSRRPDAPALIGRGCFDGLEGFRRSDEDEPPETERVESGRDLRARMFERLFRENPMGRGSDPNPDVSWVSELVM